VGYAAGGGARCWALARSGPVSAERRFLLELSCWNLSCWNLSCCLWQGSPGAAAAALRRVWTQPQPRRPLVGRAGRLLIKTGQSKGRPETTDPVQPAIVATSPPSPGPAPKTCPSNPSLLVSPLPRTPPPHAPPAPLVERQRARQRVHGRHEVHVPRARTPGWCGSPRANSRSKAKFCSLSQPFPPALSCTSDTASHSI
jgi:hypothetical protein